MNIINNYNNYNYNIGFGTKFSANKKYLDPEIVDEFVAKTINKERKSNGKINFYTDTLSEATRKKFKKEIKSSLSQFIIDNNIFFVKKNADGDLFIKKMAK